MEFNETLDREYLDRPLIKTKFKILQDSIYVSTENTCFVNCKKVDSLLQKDILELYKKVVQLAKENGVRVCRSSSVNFRKRILELWPTYTRDVKEFNTLFEELKQLVKEVEKRGIHLNWQDDFYLERCLMISNKLDSLFYTFSPILKVQEGYKTLKEYENTLLKKPNSLFVIYV